MIGDTHLGRRREWLPVELLEGLESAGLILHTGDLSTREALRLFQEIKPVYAVQGNNDRELMDELPERLRFKAGDNRIVLTHGHLEQGPTAKESVIGAYAGEADLVIFGHSHRTFDEEVNGTRFLNPGSPTMKRWEPQFSYALLDFVSDGTFHSRIVYFDKQTRPASR